MWENQKNESNTINIIYNIVQSLVATWVFYPKCKRNKNWTLKILKDISTFLTVLLASSPDAESPSLSKTPESSRPSTMLSISILNRILFCCWVKKIEVDELCVAFGFSPSCSSCCFRRSKIIFFPTKWKWNYFFARCARENTMIK